MVKKDIVFYSYLLLWFIIGIFIAVVFTNINIWIFNLIMIGIFSILCIIKKTNKKFNNWLESEL